MKKLRIVLISLTVLGLLAGFGYFYVKLEQTMQKKALLETKLQQTEENLVQQRDEMTAVIDSLQEEIQVHQNIIIEKSQRIEHLEQIQHIQQLELQNQRLELEKQTIIRNALLIIALFLLGNVILWYVRYREKKRANQKISIQKVEIETKNKEITESIEYASLIQKAILPLDDDWKACFPESFVLFRPKDIVSGDFYWMARAGSKSFVAAVDCTGHGVPGAMVSMIGYTLLNKIVLENSTHEPAEILNQLRAGITKALKQNRQENQNRDGMDIALCMIDRASRKAKFAGANNPLLHFVGGELHEIKGDRQPISYSERKNEPFKQYEIDLKDTETFYLFSDGYQDQFGGERNKKFSIKQLRNVLQELQHESMQTQQQMLESSLEKWQGDQEQIDDVLVIGMRV